jgi:hypothetical protein
MAVNWKNDRLANGLSRIWAGHSFIYQDFFAQRGRGLSSDRLSDITREAFVG